MESMAPPKGRKLSSETTGNQVTFTFAGKSLSCRPNTTVAVALWENGIRELSHSHKYGRARGVSCARGHCTSCLMRVDGIPNVRTCHTPVQQGMVVEKQDAGAFYGPPLQKVLSIGGNLFPVGFYYKWFTQPAVLSRVFLDQIRPLTGVGRIPDLTRSTLALPSAPDVSDASNNPQIEKVESTNLGNLGCIVIGAGISGMKAACAQDDQVTLIDEHPVPGGQRASALETLAKSTSTRIERFDVLASAHKALVAAKDELVSFPNIQFRGGLKAVAGYRPNGLVLRNETHLFTATFDRLIWNAGALDSLGLFPGNDTPGVMGPRALFRLLQRDGLEVKGQRVLVIGGGMDLWLSAALLSSKGAKINLVITESGYQSEVSAAVDLGWQLTTGLELAEIQNRGSQAIEATFTPMSSTPGPAHSHMRLQADFAVICRRGKPAYDIPYQLGTKLSAQPDLGGFVARETRMGAFSGKLPGGHEIQIQGEAAGALPDQISQTTSEGELS